ncbi:hypothetical protein M405DRAFT_734065 [Rhizopogon salebrosus TDB-379]|nr:hypothetical protein M405DRAFT_734065 [Rhizopogon salebrosus TDB-379]
MGIPLDEVGLLRLFLETLFYGVFLTLYLLTLFILVMKTGIQRQLLIPVATLLLCIATIHLVIGFVRALEAFVLNTISAYAYYDNLASPLWLAQTALYVLQTTLADGVIVWRCYVLNHRSLLISILGFIALLTNGAVGCYVVWSLSQTPLGTSLSSPANDCITTFYISTMAISVTCTSAIVWRIYLVRHFTPDNLLFIPVVIVIVESGALYTTSILALLIAFSTGSNAQYIMLDVVIPIVGIAFCLVILQVHFQVGGNLPTRQPAEPRGVVAGLFLGQLARDVGSIDHTVLTTVHITEEIETETEIVSAWDNWQK